MSKLYPPYALYLGEGDSMSISLRISLKKISIIFVLLMTCFLPVETMRVVLEPLSIEHEAPADQVEHDAEPQRCSMRTLFSRCFNRFRQCFTRKTHPNSSYENVLTVINAITTQSLGILSGAHIAYYTSLDPNIMMALGGVLASIVSDYLKGLSEELISVRAGHKIGFLYGVAYGNIFNAYPLHQALTSFHPVRLAVLVKATGSLDKFLQFLSEQNSLLNSILLVLELDLIADFLGSGNIVPEKYLVMKNWPKSIALLIMGIQAQDSLYALLGDNFLLPVIQGGMVVIALHTSTIKNIIDYFDREPIFKIIHNTVGDATTCSICLEYFQPNNVLALLSCNHMFHKSCLRLSNKKCPIDRQPIRPETDLQIVLFAIPVQHITPEKSPEEE